MKKKRLWKNVGLVALSTVMVGGAVLTPAYADQIGADCYAKDAMATVRYAKEIYQN